jgi:hypothetical protein
LQSHNQVTQIRAAEKTVQSAVRNVIDVDAHFTAKHRKVDWTRQPSVAEGLQELLERGNVLAIDLDDLVVRLPPVGLRIWMGVAYDRGSMEEQT